MQLVPSPPSRTGGQRGSGRQVAAAAAGAGTPSELGSLLKEPSWRAALHAELEKPYFARLDSFYLAERAGHRVFPEPDNIFRCMNTCALDAVKVVILGQDPYHTPGAAMGLAFSVPPSQPVPPSLRNIYKELEADLGLPAPKHGCLQQWCDQGVFLLNTALTVRAHQANSHSKAGWLTFTDAAIRALSGRRKGLVFLLWGKPAQQKAALVDKQKHHCLTAAHPSGLSAHKGFFGCKHFSQANAWLEKEGLQPIRWQIQ